MKNILYTFLALFVSALAYGQCGTDEYNRRLAQDHLKNGESYDEYLDRLATFESEPNYDTKTKKATRVIPVVFHVVHEYGPENISKAQIEDQLRILNEDFQRLNADKVNTRAAFVSRAVSMDVEFKLARIAPDGSCTDGITRTYDPVNTHEDYEDNDNEVKTAVAPWDRNKYLNVWVVTEIKSSSTTDTILGYAQFPGQNALTDGVVMIHNRVGTIGSANAGDAGRTLTHEVGHWLGLYHPFQGVWTGSEFSGGCTGQGDRVSDTPPVDKASFGCTANQNPNTCSNDSPNEVDNVENFMDYANGGCMNMFTRGQKDRVDGYFALTNNGRGLNISAATATATGINTTASCGPKADFWYTSNTTNICVGSSVNYTDLSYNGDVSTRTWTFEGGTPLVSTFANPTVVYNMPGVYKVELEVSNAQGTDKITKSLFVNVMPLDAVNKSPYGQDFAQANAISGWSLQKDYQNYGWNRNTQRGYSGTASLEAKIDANGPALQRFSAIMPPVDMTTHQGPLSLHYKRAYARRTADASEVLQILASTDCGLTWKNLKVANGDNLTTSGVSPDWVPTTAAHWVADQIDLSLYKSSTNLFIKFDVISRAGNSVFLDDINIGSFALSVPSYKRDVNIALIPNPAQNTLHVKIPNTINDAVVSIVDITGRLLLQQNLDPSHPIINTTEIANGAYTVRVEIAGHIWSKKLIISK
jgi:PKD repeat protein